MLLKALYLNFQCTLVKLSNAGRALSWSFIHWWQAVLLECDSNLANSCCVIAKKLNFWKVFFLQIFTFFRYFLASGSKNKLYWHKKNSQQIDLWIVDKKDKFSFSNMPVLRFVNFYWLCKKSLSSFEDKISDEVKQISKIKHNYAKGQFLLHNHFRLNGFKEKTRRHQTVPCDTNAVTFKVFIEALVTCNH